MTAVTRLPHNAGMTEHPILWSFRRCPYAIRARLAIARAGVQVELREITLRNKPELFRQTSASATVPALRIGDHVIDESLDIMVWALKQNDPARMLDMPETGWDLIATNDGAFKAALDHTKYATRYPDLDPEAERARAATILMRLNDQLGRQTWLFGDRPSLADDAIVPFVRQFANIDRDWFDAQPWPALIAWLDLSLASELFADVMVKYEPWVEGAQPIWFGKTPTVEKSSVL